MGGDPATVLVQEGLLSLQYLQIIAFQKDCVLYDCCLRSRKGGHMGVHLPEFPLVSTLPVKRPLPLSEGHSIGEQS